jgi:dephospho-CoA kinase
MIIGIAGPTASGKTTVARMLQEHLGALRIRYSDILEEIAKERGLNTSKPTLQDLYMSESQTKGEDFLAKELEARVGTLPYPMIVIEGNRRLADIEMLKRISKSKREKLVLLFIEASKEIRFERYNHRMIKSGLPIISKEEFEILEAHDSESEIGELRAIFKKEGTIINADTPTPEEVFEIVRGLL